MKGQFLWEFGTLCNSCVPLITCFKLQVNRTKGLFLQCSLKICLICRNLTGMNRFYLLCEKKY